MTHTRRPLIITLFPQSKNESYYPNLNSELSLKFLNQSTIPSDCVSEDSTEKREGYEFKGSLGRRRKFALKWKSLFPFIEYDSHKKLMFCKVCKQHATKSQQGVRFVIGTDNFRRTAIEYHERSALHAACCKRADGEAEKDCIKDTEIFDCDQRKLSLVFKLVYFNVKAKSPYSFYPYLCDAQRKEGIDLGPAYTSHQGVVPLFAAFISRTLESNLAKKLSSVRRLSLVLDHAFSRTTESHELVFLKYLNGDEVETVFIGVVESSNSAGQLMNNLNRLFLKYNVENWWDRVVFTFIDTFESCPVWINEFISELRDKNPQHFVLDVNILPHKFAQPIEVFSKYKFIINFSVIIHDIFMYCNKLVEWGKNLPLIHKALVEIKCKYGCLPKSHCSYLTYQNLGAILGDYVCLVNFIKKENESLLCLKTKQSGSKIFGNITRRKFIWELALILDLLSCLNDFCIAIQNQELMPFTLDHEIEKLCDKIHISGDGNGSNALFYKREISKSESSFKNLLTSKNCDISEVIAGMKEIASSLISSIKLPFHFNSVLKHIQVFDTRYWPEGDGMKMFGVDEFKKLYVELKENDENFSQALEEWCILKSNVNLCFSAEALKNPNLGIRNMIYMFDSQLPLITSILEKIMLLDFSSSELRKGYIEINDLKSNDRSMLSIRSLQSSMMISIHGPPLSEFDPSLALKLWFEEGRRRYRFREKKSTNSNKTDEMSLF